VTLPRRDIPPEPSALERARRRVARGDPGASSGPGRAENDPLGFFPPRSRSLTPPPSLPDPQPPAAPQSKAAKAAKAAAGGKAKKKVRIRSSRPKLRSLIPSRL